MLCIIYSSYISRHNLPYAMGIIRCAYKYWLPPSLLNMALVLEDFYTALFVRQRRCNLVISHSCTHATYNTFLSLGRSHFWCILPSMSQAQSNQVQGLFLACSHYFLQARIFIAEISCKPGYCCPFPTKYSHVKK